MNTANELPPPDINQKLDANIDAFLHELLYVKDRVNEIEATRELRH